MISVRENKEFEKGKRNQESLARKRGCISSRFFFSMVLAECIKKKVIKQIFRGKGVNYEDRRGRKISR